MLINGLVSISCNDKKLKEKNCIYSPILPI